MHLAGKWCKTRGNKCAVTLGPGGGKLLFPSYYFRNWLRAERERLREEANCRGKWGRRLCTDNECTRLNKQHFKNTCWSARRAKKKEAIGFLPSVLLWTPRANLWPARSCLSSSCSLQYGEIERDTVCTISAQCLIASFALLSERWCPVEGDVMEGAKGSEEEAAAGIWSLGRNRKGSFSEWKSVP